MKWVALFELVRGTFRRNDYVIVEADTKEEAEKLAKAEMRKKYHKYYRIQHLIGVSKWKG